MLVCSLHMDLMLEICNFPIPTWRDPHVSKILKLSSAITTVPELGYVVLLHYIISNIVYSCCIDDLVFQEPYPALWPLAGYQTTMEGKEGM